MPPEHKYIGLFALLLTLCALIIDAANANTIPQDNSAAVILAYHRIDEDAFPETNLRFEQFETHINHIVAGEYNVQPLKKIVADIRQENTLPPRTIAITFEGGYKSILKKALPLLQAQNLPYTIFYASDLADVNTKQYLNWNDLQQIKRDPNAEFGILPASYQHLNTLSIEESKRLINNAHTAHRKQFNQEASFFSYPFGEWNNDLRDFIKSQKFDAAFGLQSGAIYAAADKYTLPRFSITENYGDIERFHMIANAQPLPVSEQEPADPYLKNSADTLKIGFTLDPALQQEIKNLACYISGHPKPNLEIIGDNRIELRPKTEINHKRIRINCTMPADNNHWRWFGILLTQP